MEIEVNEQKQIVLKKVFDTIILQTEEGDKLAIYMRDNVIEMSVAGSEKWYRTNLDTGDIEEI